MSFGYCGKILRVNLTNRSITTETPDDKFYRAYLGGRALIAYYLLKEVPADCDPLGPENKLIFAAGPLTGAPIAGSGRNSVGAKSPLTGGYGDGEAGGFWGAELKRAGYDAAIIEGQAERPVYLFINDDEISIRPASHLWGQDTLAVQEAIQAELGDDRIRIAQCGPAGEQLVRYAAVAHDITHWAGRTGMGAVMGSKKLRAIAVRGSQPVPVADKENLTEYARYLAENVETLAGGLKANGTAGGVMSLSASGGLPTRNFQEGSFEGAERISGPTMTGTILVDRENCYACPIYCKRVVKVDQPYRVDPKYGGPEYETIASLGSLCGIDDLPAVAKGNERCGALGLDTISTGVCIAFAMECFERGILTEQDTDGLKLRFGNAAAMLELIEKIARREGIGALLAEGVRRAADKLGGEAPELAIHIKGQEVPMHEPRLKHGLGVGYAVSPTGADHCHNLHDTIFAKEGPSIEAFKALGVQEPLPVDDLSAAKVRMVYYVSNWRHFANSAVYCYFVPWDYLQMEGIMRAVTGWNTTVFELMKVGERANTLTRLFNLRAGFTREEDYLTRRFTKPFASGPLAGVAVPADQMERAIADYYAMMGWDAEGRPTPARLGELGISWAVQN